MAKVKITGHASGTGVVTVTAPNTSTDRVITLPDSTATLATTAEAFNPDAAQVFNESGADVDFRVEGSGEANALFVQGSDGNVGIGTNTPTGFEIRDKVIRISKQSSVTAYRIIGNDKGNDLAIQSSNTADGTAYTSRLNIMNDGRGLSQFTAKAWVNIDSGTLADGHNISSVGDNGTGEYSVNFANNLANDNYSVTVGQPYRNGSGYRALVNTYNPNVNNITVVTFERTSSWVAADLDRVSATIFGD